MANSELLSYVKQVMDLETSLYTNLDLQDGFSDSVKSEMPDSPPKPCYETVKEPVCPSPPIFEAELKKQVIDSVLAGIGLIIMGAVLTWSSVDKDFPFILTLLFSLESVLGILFLVCIPKFVKDTRTKKKAEYTAALNVYHGKNDEYRKLVPEVAKRNEARKQEYKADMEEYGKCVERYKGRCEKSEQYIWDAGVQLKSALEQLYSADVIYPKYRNLVAVTMIYEYLASGRCSELEGPNGAYNLYEMELRQNIIIGQLSSILDRLEQIRSNQFTLYNELEKSNQESARLLSDISNNVEFNRYASEETAKANAAIAQNTEATKYYTLFNAAKRK